MAAMPGAEPTDLLSSDPAFDADSGASTDQDQGFSIEINVDGEGNITVECESANDADSDEGSEGGQSAPTIDAALKIAKQMYLAQSNGGVSPQAAWDQEAAARGPATATA